MTSGLSVDVIAVEMTWWWTITIGDHVLLSLAVSHIAIKQSLRASISSTQCLKRDSLFNHRICWVWPKHPPAEIFAVCLVQLDLIGLVVHFQSWLISRDNNSRFAWKITSGQHHSTETFTHPFEHYAHWAWCMNVDLKMLQDDSVDVSLVKEISAIRVSVASAWLGQKNELLGWEKHERTTLTTRPLTFFLQVATVHHDVYFHQPPEALSKIYRFLYCTNHNQDLCSCFPSFTTHLLGTASTMYHLINQILDQSTPDR